jgi:MFS family permease
MLGLGAVLLVIGTGGSYALAGLVSATLALAGALAAPVIGTLADRYGQGRVLRPSVVVHAVGVAAMVLVGVSDVSAVGYFPAAVLAGGAAPQMSSLVRARWASIVGGTPALHTVLATGVWAPGGVAAAGCLAVVGGLGLAAQHGTEPLPRTTAVRQASAIRTPGLRVVAAVTFALGGLFGTLDVAMVGFADDHGGRGYAGLLLACVALGSLVAGLAYGIREWRWDLRRRFLLGLLALTGSTVVLAAAPGVAVMAPVAVLAGMAIAPTLVASMGLVEALVPAGALTEGFAWVGTAIGFGLAVGASVAGRIVDVSSGHRAFLVAVVASVLGLALASAGGRWLRTAPS